MTSWSLNWGPKLQVPQETITCATPVSPRKMDVLKLIEEVQGLSVLYDRNHKRFYDFEYTDQIWALISKTLQHPDVACKNKWNSIRESFRRNLKKRKATSGMAAANTKKYKYEDALHFLIPYMAEQSEKVQSQEEGEKEVETAGTSDQVNKLPANSFAPTTIGKSGKTTTMKRKSNINNACEKPSRLLKPYKLEEKRALKKIKKANQEAEKNHPVDDFLASIAHSLKSLDPMLFFEAKSKIFSTVDELEKKQLMISLGHSTMEQAGLLKMYSPSPSSISHH